MKIFNVGIFYAFCCDAALLLLMLMKIIGFPTPPTEGRTVTVNP